MDTGTTPMNLAGLVAAGQFDEWVRDALRRGFATFVNAGGTVTLERALRLPRGTASFRLAQRDLWLAEVVKSTEGKSPWARYVAASAALDAFLSRGQWRAWCDMQDPPLGTSDLRTALFFVSKFNGGKGLSTKQVSRIVGRLFHSQCP